MDDCPTCGQKCPKCGSQMKLHFSTGRIKEVDGLKYWINNIEFMCPRCRTIVKKGEQ